MPEITLDGTARSHDIGGGYQITAVDIVGALESGDSRGERSRGFFEDGLDALLEDAGLNRDKVIRIVPDDRAAENERGLSRTRTVTLHVPKDKELGSLVLVEDQATGAASWHLPAPSGSRAVSPVATQRFDIPIDVTPGVGALHERGFPRVSGVVLKVFTYPIGKIVKGFVRKWERTNRPYLVRSYTPANYTDSRKDFPALDADGWNHVSDGRALLFIHGTFSSAAAFSDLPSNAMEQLSAQYGGRLFAFNHFTMTDDPATNATEFLDALPEGVSLDVDIVCHSRGGLVARELVAQGADRGLRVGKVIFVGATNAGTTLADKEHIIKLLDRFTTFAKLLPGPVQTVVDAVAVALQVLAKSLLTELTGLQAMDPDGKYMKRLNVPGGQTIEGYAIASHFEPKPGTAWYKLTRIGDATVDAIFGQKPNDLVVPRDGVFTGVNAAGFPISAERCLLFGDTATGENDAVIHTQFFAQRRAQQAILSWLGGAGARSGSNFRSGDSQDGSVPVLEQLEVLRPHVVNLSGGSFRKSGKYSTSPADVDAIFSEHLPQWMAPGGGGSGKPLRIVFFAHGGLINEQDGLGIARKHVEWWKANGIYPIYFVWETGLFDALRAILEGVARQIPGFGTRGIFDDLTDKLVEKGVRALGGPKVWQAMKTNAMLSSGPKGGARYVAEQLTKFCEANPGVELHAAGHSAGAIFHSHFLPATLELSVPAFASLQVLAPAVRIDAFKERLVPLTGPERHIRSLRMLTMKDNYERDDNCIRIYRKSLLYLIHHSLEPKSETPMLGLEISVVDDPEMRRFFAPASGGPASAIWSVTGATAPPSAASHSISHGGFDDDRETMSSVAAHVLGTSAALVPYPGSRALGGEWPVAREWIGGFASASVGIVADAAAEAMPSTHTTKDQLPIQASSSRPPSVVPASGRRTALCIGIDAYRGHELEGCVADATSWASAFTRLGFDVTLLRDAEGTLEGILGSLRKLISDSRPGDILAFQYAGHGYQLADIDGDEEDGTDEALVPFDFENGAFVLDDDIRAVLSEIKAGVNLTCFIDSCHSGSVTRVFELPTPDSQEVDRIIETGRARFLKTSRAERDELEKVHRMFRAEMDKTRTTASRSFFKREDLRWVNFSAAQPTEKALEHQGHGDFTTRAIDLLSGLRGPVTNLEFNNRLIERFGSVRAQTPSLDAGPLDEAAPFLSGLLAI